MIDGSNSCARPEERAAATLARREVRHGVHLGIPYTMTNAVIEFEEGGRMAWRPRPAARLGESDPYYPRSPSEKHRRTGLVTPPVGVTRQNSRSTPDRRRRAPDGSRGVPMPS